MQGACRRQLCGVGTWETALSKEWQDTSEDVNEFVCLGGFLDSKKQWKASARMEVLMVSEDR